MQKIKISSFEINFLNHDKREYIKKNLYPIVLSILVLLSCYKIHVLTMLWRVTLIVSIVLLLLETISLKYKYSKLAWILSVFLLISFISTLWNQKINVTTLGMYLRTFLYIFWCDLYFKKHTQILFESHIIIVGILFCIQLIFQITNPEFFGYTASENLENFLVSDNYMGYYMVPFLTLLFAYGKCKNVKFDIKAWAFLSVCILSIFIANAGTCILGISLFAILMVFESLINKGRLKINTYIIYSVYFIFLIGIMVFSIQDYFSTFLAITTGKGVSFSGRTYIWDRFPIYFFKHPWIGYGISNDGTASVIKVLTGPSFLLGYYWHVHNYFLEILICGGIFQMIPYILLLYLVAKNSNNCKNNKIGNIIKLGILAMFFMYTTEGLLLEPPQYLIYFLGYYCSLFDETNFTVLKNQKTDFNS